jgi:Flp pilus assembly protein TadD
MKILPIDLPGGWRGMTGPLSARSLNVSSAVAALAILASGCQLAQTRPQPVPIPPAVPQNVDGVATVDVTQAAATRDFHKNATERQRFQVHLDFGKVFEAQGNLDAAVVEYQGALDVVKTRRRGELTLADEALANRRMGGAFDRLGRFAQAEVHYKKALKLTPKEPKIWNDVGYSYYLQQRWSDAERALRTAMKLAPEDARTRTNLGLTLAAAGRTSEALPLLSQAEGDATGHVNLGYLLAATGQYELARQQYETALALEPNLALAHRALAQLDRQQHGVPQPASSLTAQKLRTSVGTADPRVAPASASTGGRFLLPPPPPLPSH